MVDLLASPTLALLYLQQGHLKRARRVIDALLERDPCLGAALALRARLDARPRGQLHCVLENDEVWIRWSGLAPQETPQLAIFFEGAGAPTQGLQIMAFPGGIQGGHRIARSFGRASVVAAIGRGSTAATFEARLVSEPVYG